MKLNIKPAVHTFDTDFQPKDAPKSDEELDSSRCFSLIFLHAGCFGVIWVGWSWFALGVAVFFIFYTDVRYNGFSSPVLLSSIV